jgi:D-lactate dehydrogenase (cytochrome)
LAEAFAAIVGGDAVTTSPSELLRHGSDESYHEPAAPELVVYPGSTHDVVEVVRECTRRSLPLIPFGAGTSIEGGVTAPEGGVCLDMSRMNRVLELRVTDLDVSVQAGVTRLQLERALGPEGLFFPVDPGADATLGGMISTGASGTTAVGYGTMRENVLSLRVVLPNGEVLRTRSRARKSSAGYDLTHLFIGAEGTLGVITEAVLRAHPLPECVSAAVCSFPTLSAAADCVIAAIQSGMPTVRAELLDELQMEAIRQRFALPYAAEPTVFFEFHGSAAYLEALATDVAELAGGFDARHLEWATRPAERRRLWEARHRAYEATLALRPGSQGFTTDVCVPISRLAECILATRADIEESGLVATIVGHVGDGNFHAIVLIDPGRPDELARAQELTARMVRRAIEMDGTCTGEHGIGSGKRGFLELEHGRVAVELMRTLKHTIDPAGLFNPGKVIPS